MDEYEEEFGAIVVTSAEGWSAHTEEASLNSKVDRDDDDKADSVDRDMSVPVETQAAETQTHAQTQAQTQAGSSRAKSRHKKKDVVVEACAKRTEALEKNKIIVEQMLELEYAFSVVGVLKILNGLRRVIMWSPFYEAAIEHLLANEASMQDFISFSRAEDKIRFLELRTKTKLDD